MSHDPLTYEDLLRIVELIKSSEQFSEFRLKVGDVEIELRRRNAAAAPASHSSPYAPPAAPFAPPPSSAPSTTPRPSDPAAHSAPSTIASASSSAPSTAATPMWPDDALVIRAPMVGTFYRAPEPGARPFVEPGQSVDDHTIVCIIEVMKLMNSIPAGARGIVTHVLVDDATSVETGQPLIVLQPELPAP